MLYAIVGMTGSGKSEATSILEKHGFSKLRFGEITMDILKGRGLPVSEENERKVREELRREHGMAAYAILNLPKIRSLMEKNSKVVLDGLYSWEEYLVLKAEFPELKVIAISSSPATRYSRLEHRRIRPLTHEEAASRDKAEIENLHKAGPIAMADITILNESSYDDLRMEMERIS